MAGIVRRNCMLSQSRSRLASLEISRGKVLVGVLGARAAGKRLGEECIFRRLKTGWMTFLSVWEQCGLENGTDEQSTDQKGESF
jgi:hypothetical protein